MKKAIFFIWILVISFSSIHAQTKVMAFHKKEIKLEVNAYDRLSNWAKNYVKEVPPPNASSETRVMFRRGSSLRRPARYGGASSATAARKAKDKQKDLSNRCALACIYEGGDPYRCTNFCDCVYVNNGNIFSCLRSGSVTPASATQKAKGK